MKPSRTQQGFTLVELLVALFASHPVTMARIAQAWLWAERH